MDEIGLIHTKNCYFGQKGTRGCWPLNLFTTSLSIHLNLENLEKMGSYRWTIMITRKIFLMEYILLR